MILCDDRVAPGFFAEYDRIATRCVAVEFEHLERHLELAHSLCETEWVFRIDTDEVPSPALVARLPELLRDPEVQEYHIARRWLFPSADTWLN